MQRTSILLPPALKKKADRVAAQRGISLGEMIRRGLEADVAGSRKGADSVPTFFQRQPWTGKVPADLSARHDDYLYGDSA